VGLAYQVISIFCIVVASIYVSPDRIAPLCALILPVLAAALCFNFASVMLVQLAALSVIAVRVLDAPHAERGLFIGFGIVMIAGFAIVGAIVRHREVLHQLQLGHFVAEGARARALLEASFDGTATVVEGKCVSVSPGFCSALKVQEEDLLSHSFMEAMPFTLRPGSTREDALPYLDSDGSMRYVAVIRQAVTGADVATEIVAVRDVTMEQLHRANLQFADRMSSVGMLATGVAHEVNNALMTLTGQTEIAAIHASNGDNDEVKNSLQRIQTASQRISGCISELQRFSGSAASTPRALCLNDIVRSTLSLAQHRIKGSADLSVQLTDKPTQCLAVDGWIAQILTNLILNALHAVADEEAPCISVTTKHSGEKLTLEVSDNGPGVPTELSARIFQPFFSTKGARGGSGLGLSVSARIASRMGASLTLEPTQRGAHFILTLPMLVVNQPVDNKSTVVPPPSEDLSVLILEDDEGVGQVMQTLLQPAQTTWVRTLGDAKTRFNDSIDLIISDLTLETDTGLDFFEWLRVEHPTATNRFVLLSGNVKQLNAARTSLPEEVRVLSKPISQSALWKLVSGAES